MPVNASYEVLPYDDHLLIFFEKEFDNVILVPKITGRLFLIIYLRFSSIQFNFGKVLTSKKVTYLDLQNCSP